MKTKAPFNYIGNKYRIIDSIQKFFPKQINTMVDLFCGGCDVSINTKAKSIYANDINCYVINICREFQKHDIDFLLNYIDSTIAKWKLTKQNEDAYLKFRKHYNITKNTLDLYILMCYSFNYQFRFNSDHEFNNPFGHNRSSFNNVIRKNLIIFKTLIDNITFSTVDFTIFDYSILKHGDFLYADPPYLITCGSYNDGKRGFNGWNQNYDNQLMKILTQLSHKGVKFALSNVIEHKGQKNNILLKWVRDNKYHIHRIKFNYNNCNYQTQNKKNITKEVLITNY